MTKLNASIVALIAIGLLVGSAVAWAHMGGWGHMGSTYANNGNGYYNYTDEDLAARNQFLKDTADLRKELASKRIQLEAVMSGANPNAEVAGKLSKEIYELRQQINEKAENAGVGGPIAGEGYGYHGWGMHGGGWGMHDGGGYCWR